MSSPWQDHWDAIIVGAGSAGAVLAHRLSQDQKRRVLLLDAGAKDNSLIIKVPIGYAHNYTNPKYNWLFHTEPDAQTRHRRHFWPRGKVLGGSSSINAMVIMRGLKHDYDIWANRSSPDWTWSTLQPYYDRLRQHFHFAVNPEAQHPLCKDFFRACQQCRIPVVDDLNAAENTTVGYYPQAIQSGQRVSSSTAYLKPLGKRHNLCIRPHTLVKKLHWHNKKITGVEVTEAGQTHIIKAHDVILATGAIHTPLLLENSGIGDGHRLQKLTIEVKQHLPMVGENLADHLGCNHYFNSPVSTLNDALGSWWGRVQAVWRYVSSRKGPFSVSVNQAGGLISLDGQGVPDIQLYFSPIQYHAAPKGTRAKVGVNKDSGFLIGYNQCRPTSVGSVHLRQPDDLHQPLINPNYLSTEEDQQCVIRTVKWMRRFCRMPAMQTIITKEIFPGAAVVRDDEILDDFRARCGSVYHPCGSARMGNDSQSAVVDARCRVHGIAGLRIIDASALPIIPSANISLPIMLLAEQASDMFLADCCV